MYDTYLYIRFPSERLHTFLGSDGRFLLPSLENDVTVSVNRVTCSLESFCVVICITTYDFLLKKTNFLGKCWAVFASELRM